MPWPLSQDFNEAIQNPSSAFADADLKGGTVTTTPLGVPLPRSGNYADVYQVTGKDGKPWAVKCFTRTVAPDLQARYAAIAKHLAEANLPFTVGFEFLADGIRVKGQPYPAVKMQWVEGFALNTFVRDNLGRATILESMLSLWVRLCRRLRETGMAHCDLQHGNVILVPGEAGKNVLGLKLVDYDGMFVPALAGKPPGEAGHASFQHPQRVQINAYSADLDKFPHLVVATALRGLLIGGKALWDKYDTGDNLLFQAKDFTTAHQSKVMRELWDSGDPFTVGLLSHLVISCAKPLNQTPWLDTLMPEGRPPVLTPSQERQAMQLLGVPVAGAVPKPAEPQPEPESELPIVEGSQAHKALKATNNSKILYGAIAAGVIAAIGIAAAVVAFSGGKKDSGQAHNSGSSGSSSKGSARPPIEPPINPPVNPPINPPVEPPPPLPPGVKEGKALWAVDVKDGDSSTGRTVSYSLDGGKLIVPMSETGRIRVYDAKDGKLIATFKDHAPTAQVLAAPLPGGKVLSIGAEPNLLVWDDSTGKASSKVIARGPAGTPDLLQTDVFGQYALVCIGKRAAVIDLDDHKEILVLDMVGGGAPGRAAAMLSADGRNFLILAADGKLKTYTLPANKDVEVKPDFDRPAVIVAWSPAKNLAVLRTRKPDGSISTTLHVVDTKSGKEVKALTGYGGRCAFTPDDVYLVAVTTDGRINFLDPTNGEIKASAASKPAGGAYDLAVSPDGGSAAFVSGADKQLALVAPPWEPVKVARTPPQRRTSKPPTIPSTDPPTPASTRKAVPTEEALKSAEKTVKDIFKDQYSKKLPAERRKLAEALLKTAAEKGNDPAAKFFMLHEVQSISVELADARLGARAIDLVETDFEVDGMALRVSLLERIGATASKTDVLKALAETCGEMVEELAEKNEFDLALKLTSVGLAALARANLPNLGRDLEARQNQLRKQKELFEPVKAALEALKKDPKDAAASTTVGRFRCFVQGRWTEGLPLLAAGADEKLKEVSALDLTGEIETPPIKKADSWWNSAQTALDADKPAALARAKFWYARVLSGGSGIERAQAEKRLAFSEAGSEYRLGLVCEVLPAGGIKGSGLKKVVKLSPTADLATADYKDKDLWGNAIGVKLTGYLLPPAPGRYKITLEGKSRTMIKLFAQTDQKTIINLTAADADDRRDATLVLPAKPVAFYLEALLYCHDVPRVTASKGPQSIVLKWLRPGAKSEESIPPEAFFHTKGAEAMLTEK